MFTNLKNKLIEEVKASPSKFQQFANAAQAAVTSTNTTALSGSQSVATNENFFSITEDDTPQNSPTKPARVSHTVGRMHANNNASPQSNGSSGAFFGARKLSNASITSDTSFRMSSYDAPAVYNLQSDLDVSASELEDSNSAIKLDAISKEQLFDIYKKSLERYHKYRCRYTDLAKIYKDLERDSSQARSVLVETQEKAIRRISELREQCSLEQLAKAHLEESLRLEIDDMQCKMLAYQTKLQVLGENPDEVANEAKNMDAAPVAAKADDMTNGNVTSSDISLESNDGDKSKSEIECLREQLSERERQLHEVSAQLAASSVLVETLRKQEDENALQFAQTKQAIYAELEDKDREVKGIKDAFRKLQNELKRAITFEEQLKAKEAELDELRQSVRRMETMRYEVEAKNIANEHLIADMKENVAAKEKDMLAIENRYVSAKKETEKKLLDIREENAQLREMIERYQRTEISLAEIDNELNRTKNENDTLRTQLQASADKVEQLDEELRQQRALGARHESELLASREQLRENESSGKKCLEMVVHELGQLDSQLANLSEQMDGDDDDHDRGRDGGRDGGCGRGDNDDDDESMMTTMMTMTRLRKRIVSLEKQLENKENEQQQQQRRQQCQEERVKDQAVEIEKLERALAEHETHLQRIQCAATENERRADDEKNELKQQITNILNEIKEMEKQMALVKESHAQLLEEKRALVLRVEEMEERHIDDTNWLESVKVSEASRHDAMERRYATVEEENKRLTEANARLGEQLSDLEKVMAEERQRNHEANERMTRESADQLRAERQQLSAENAHLLRIERDYHELLASHERLDREKVTIADALGRLEEDKVACEKQLNDLVEELTQKCTRWQQQLQPQLTENETMKAELERTRVEVATAMRLLDEKQKQIHDLENQNAVHAEKLKVFENEFVLLREKLSVRERTSAELEKMNAALKLRFEELEGESMEVAGGGLVAGAIANRADVQVSTEVQTDDDDEVRLGDKEQEILDLRHEIDRHQLTIGSLQDALRSEIMKSSASVLPDAMESILYPEASTSLHGDADGHFHRINLTLQRELADLQSKSSAEIVTLLQENEDLHNQVKKMKAEKHNHNTVATSMAPDDGMVPKLDDKDELQSKLDTIVQEVKDVSNRNLFLEQKCENYLILEQSNERLKLQNAKLLRQLDETLISLQHNEAIGANTEFEYLKNIMFQYLTGSSNYNNDILVKVISAVLKFSPQQTQVAIEKEHQRRSLLNKII